MKCWKKKDLWEEIRIKDYFELKIGIRCLSGYLGPPCAEVHDYSNWGMRDDQNLYIVYCIQTKNLLIIIIIIYEMERRKKNQKESY